MKTHFLFLSPGHLERMRPVCGNRHGKTADFLSDVTCLSCQRLAARMIAKRHAYVSRTLRAHKDGTVTTVGESLSLVPAVRADSIAPISIS